MEASYGTQLERLAMPAKQKRHHSCSPTLAGPSHRLASRSWHRLPAESGNVPTQRSATGRDPRRNWFIPVGRYGQILDLWPLAEFLTPGLAAKTGIGQALRFRRQSHGRRRRLVAESLDLSEAHPRFYCQQLFAFWYLRPGFAHSAAKMQQAAGVGLRKRVQPAPEPEPGHGPGRMQSELNSCNRRQSVRKVIANSLPT